MLKVNGCFSPVSYVGDPPRCGGVGSDRRTGSLCGLRAALAAGLHALLALGGDAHKKPRGWLAAVPLARAGRGSERAHVSNAIDLQSDFRSILRDVVLYGSPKALKPRRISPIETRVPRQSFRDQCR